VAIQTDWLQSLLGQRLFVAGVEVLPTTKQWDLQGFTATYDAVTGRVVIRAASDWKESARLVSTSNRALSGLAAVDGVTPVANDRILLAGQTNPVENGLWSAASGTWTRTLDADQNVEVTAGATVRITEGATYAGTGWTLQGPDPITVGVSSQTWVQTAALAYGLAADTFTCPATVLVRDVVYLSAADTVDKADANVVAQMPAIGVVLAKPTATSATVVFAGPVTGFAGLTPQLDVYVDKVTPGGLTQTAPSASGDRVQKVGFARNATTIIVMVDRDFTVVP
jgi:uncharacterized cupin superfamily protein